MPAVGAVVFVGAALIMAAGDAVMSAAIAGVFSIVNTCIGFVLVREQRRVRRTLHAPRRLVYDAQGNPIGTVLDLSAMPAPTGVPILAGGRRADDEPLPPL